MSIDEWFSHQGDRRPDDDRSARSPRIDPETGEILESRSSAPASDPRATSVSHEIPGERTVASVNRERSIRTRVANTLALGTVGLIGCAFFLWYYASQLQKADTARRATERQTEARAAGDFVVPPLGRVDPPESHRAHASTATSVVTSTSVATSSDLFGAAPPLPPPPLPTTPTAAGPYGATPYPAAQPAAPAKTPQQLELERKLTSPVLLYPQQATAASPKAAIATPPLPGLSPGSLPRLLPTSTGPETPANAGLAAQLTPTVTPAVAAQVLPTRRMLLPKGAFIDCTLETAIDSTHEGMTTCIGANDVYSADGSVVLLERGTKYVGERRGGVRRGQNRVFVLWSQARTPTGVVVDLASPGTDELGRAGLPGHIDTHFWDRFGAAILISVIDGSMQALAASQQRSSEGNAVTMNPRGGGDVLTEVLRNTIDIPPTVVKNQGDRIQVLVARDIDFRSVYALRTESDGQ